MSLMAQDDDELEKWLARCSHRHNAPMDLLEQQGKRLAAAGDLTGARAKFDEAVRGYADELNRQDEDRVAVNNTALLLSRITEVTGDLAHLERAVQLMESLVSKHPGDTIELRNLNDLYKVLVYRHVMAHFFDPKEARFSDGQLVAVMGQWMDSPLRAEVKELLRRDPGYRRYRELDRALQRLAPQDQEAYRDELLANDYLDDLLAQRALVARVSQAFAAPPAASAARLPGPVGALPAPQRYEPHPPDAATGSPGDSPIFKQLTPKASRRARAVAWWLIGRARDQDADVPDEDTIDAYLHAHELWPELGTLDDAGHVQVRAALGAAADDSELGARWNPKDTPGKLAVLALLLGPDGPQARTLLLARADLRIGVTWQLGRPAPLARLDDAVLAYLWGDGARYTRSVAELRTEPRLLFLRGRARLYPDDEQRRYELAWLEAL
jgi:hypothetical protein